MRDKTADRRELFENKNIAGLIARFSLPMVAAMRSADGQHDEVQRAVVDVMRAWDDGLSAEFDDPVTAEIVRLVGDGIYIGALLGLPRPDHELHRALIERLLGASGPR